jgi:hypothetical protein
VAQDALRRLPNRWEVSALSTARRGVVSERNVSVLAASAWIGHILITLKSCSGTIIDRARPQAPHGIHVDERVRLAGIGLKCAQRLAG